jgi:hypothetical protein
MVGAALLCLIEAHKLVLTYEDSFGPTKEDNGENDNEVTYREGDINMMGDKVSGWKNPLAMADDGSDDDQILNMQFPSLNEDYELSPEEIISQGAELDDDIVIS